MSSWNLFATIACALMGILMLVRELRRRDRRRMALRCLASLLAIVGLCGMGLKIKKPPTPESGLASGEIIVNDSAGEKQHAFTEIHWQQELKSGQPLIVEGRYVNTNGTPVTICLHEFNTTLDSIHINNGEAGIFHFNAIPRQRGKALFQISVKDKNKILETEPLPVVIKQPDSLNLVILSSYPDFENKFLDQWLSKNHVGVAQRTRISRDRYEKNFINRQPVEMNRITEELLRPFDLMICDVAAFSSLSAAEQNSIRHQVIESGMGLMIRIDSVRDKKTFYDEWFPAYRFSAKTAVQRTLYTTDSLNGMVYPGNQDLTGIRHRPGNQPLVQNREGLILVSSRLEGNGKIIFSTLNNTYNWSLDGKMQTYGAFWTYLIHQSARKQAPVLKLWPLEKFPRKNQPVHFRIQTHGERLPEPIVNREPFYLMQDKNISNEWEGIYWPKQTGWQPAVHLADHYFEWYVYEAKDWPEFISVGERKSASQSENERNSNIFYFLLFFMSGWTFLWVERKLSLI